MQAPRCRKSDFSLDPERHYLNCAYMAPFSKNVEEAISRAMVKRRTPHLLKDGDYFEGPEVLRKRFGKLVNGDSERVAVIPSASYGLATAAQNLAVEEGQSIVVTAAQFPSNIYAWRRLRPAGVKIVTVSPPESRAGRGEGWNARILEAISKDTAIVAMGHVHWTDGTRFDLEAIGARAREVGAALVIDGTQSVGALPFDIEKIQPDALICAAYKWLMGPYGLGLAYFGPRFDQGQPLEDNWVTRRGAEDFKNLVKYQDEYAPGARRYDVGQRSNFLTLPGAIQALDEILDYGPEQIQIYCEALLKPHLPELEALGISIESFPWRASHLFGLRLPEGADIFTVKKVLEARQVYVSLRGDAVRVSPHVYNDEADMAALVSALSEGLRSRPS